MKPSHRKDVIIARIIFAAICIFIIAGITAIIVTLTSRSHKKSDAADNQQNAVSESVTESGTDTEIGNVYIPQATTEATGDAKTYVVTTSSVNMREKADKNANILTVIAADVKLEFVSEDNGWTQVIFQGQTGYVSSDYVKTSLEDGTTGDNTAGDGTADSGSTAGSDTTTAQ